MNLDLRVYLVTGESDSATTLKTVSAAVAGGVTAVQYRNKHEDTRARSAVAGRLASALEASGLPLLVNDDVEAAQTPGVAGVHLGPDDMHPGKARDLLGPDALIGWSIHDLDQLSDNDAIDASDYLAASPVWETQTKLDTTPPLGLEGVKALRIAMPERLPLVGIGGISADNAGDLIRAGAGGIAIVSAIWNATDPASMARRLRAIVDAALEARNGS